MAGAFELIVVEAIVAVVLEASSYLHHHRLVNRIALSLLGARLLLLVGETGFEQRLCLRTFRFGAAKQAVHLRFHP